MTFAFASPTFSPEKPKSFDSLFKINEEPFQKHNFQEKDDLTDVTLVVEGKRLYVHKTFLAVHSPVFRKMFFSDFKEKESHEVVLPEKKSSAMVSFLTQIYPGHSFRTVTDDTLPDILQLADEYQAEQVMTDCEQYMGTQIQLLGNQMTQDQMLLYLRLMTQYCLRRHFHALLDQASRKSVHVLQTSKHFKSVPLETMKELLIMRCKALEVQFNRVHDAAITPLPPTRVDLF